MNEELEDEFSGVAGWFGADISHDGVFAGFGSGHWGDRVGASRAAGEGQQRDGGDGSAVIDLLTWLLWNGLPFDDAIRDLDPSPTPFMRYAAKLPRKRKIKKRHLYKMKRNAEA